MRSLNSWHADYFGDVIRSALQFGRLVLIAVGLLNGLVGARAGQGTGSTPTETERLQLIEAVKKLNEQYDPQERMIRRAFSSPGYHTTLKGGQVHPTRDSLSYAVALLNTEAPEWQKEAEEILRKVIAAGAENAHVPEILGWERADNLTEAIAMARSYRRSASAK